jgi:hypothetical protein
MCLFSAILFLIRLGVGGTFILYGLVKLLGGQFFFSHDWVISGRTTDGPTLVWCFYGYSPVYGRLIGLAELVPGALLLLPRLRTVGALLLLPVSAHITVLDFCFDFPAVKYFSLLLTLGCVILLLADGRTLGRAAWLLVASPQRNAITPKDAGTATRFQRWSTVKYGLIALVALPAALFVANLLVAAVAPNPVDIARDQCVQRGWAKDQLELLGWRTDSWSGINVNGYVEFETTGPRLPRLIRVAIHRPHSFTGWQVVDYQERRAPLP